MRNDLSDITVVMDRSGSMSACHADAEGGLNAFIAKQKGSKGDALFTLVQFDTVYEFVHKGIPIQTVPHCQLEPRGMTALLDAVGRAIVETGERLKNIAEYDRPGLVAFVIITDGHENSSVEFTKTRVKEMIEHQTNQYKWHFIFLGANQDAFAEAGRLGIPTGGALNYAAHKTRCTYDATGDLVSRMRGQAVSGQTVSCDFTPEERKATE
jgi:hypothetical protein